MSVSAIGLTALNLSLVLLWIRVRRLEIQTGATCCTGTKGVCVAKLNIILWAIFIIEIAAIIGVVSTVHAAKPIAPIGHVETRVGPVEPVTPVTGDLMGNHFVRDVTVTGATGPQGIPGIPGPPVSLNGKICAARFNLLVQDGHGSGTMSLILESCR